MYVCISYFFWYLNSTLVFDDFFKIIVSLWPFIIHFQVELTGESKETYLNYFLHSVPLVFFT